jgi:hypothetical protein
MNGKMGNSKPVVLYRPTWSLGPWLFPLSRPPNVGHKRLKLTYNSLVGLPVCDFWDQKMLVEARFAANLLSLMGICSIDMLSIS